MKVIIFNAPPGAGKDEAINYLKKKGTVFPFSFKSRLTAITLAIYNIPEKVWEGWYTREGKELPREELDGLSCRNALIKTSEEVIKPVFGKQYFGKMEARNVKQNAREKYYVAACSDGGFNEEIVPLMEEFGPENVFIVYITRPGCTFAGDSRNWIDIENIPNENYIHIYNDDSFEHLYKQVDEVMNYVTEES